MVVTRVSLLMVSILLMAPGLAQSAPPPSKAKPPAVSKPKPIGSRVKYVSRLPRNSRVNAKDGDGGSRGGCPSKSGPLLTALVPQDGISHTTLEWPPLWFYIPYESRDGSQLDYELILELYDNKRTLLHRTYFIYNVKAGIIKLQLPTSAHALKINERYRWKMTVVCDKSSSDNPYVESYQERVPIIKLPLNAHEKVVFAASKGLWSDTLALLLQQQPLNPLAQEDLTDLLESVGLEQFRDQPQQNCCTHQ